MIRKQPVPLAGVLPVAMGANLLFLTRLCQNWNLASEENNAFVFLPDLLPCRTRPNFVFVESALLSFGLDRSFVICCTRWVRTTGRSRISVGLGQTQCISLTIKNIHRLWHSAVFWRVGQLPKMVMSLKPRCQNLGACQSWAPQLYADGIVRWDQLREIKMPAFCEGSESVEICQRENSSGRSNSLWNWQSIWLVHRDCSFHNTEQNWWLLVHHWSSVVAVTFLRAFLAHLVTKTYLSQLVCVLAGLV